MRSGRVVLCTILLATGALACPGTLENLDLYRPRNCGGAGQAACTSTTTQTTPAAPVELLTNRCGFAGCHGAMSPQAGLDLSSVGVEARLISEVSASATCSGKTLVEPGKPEESLLYAKLVMPPCGAMMPPTGALANEEIEQIREWILSLGDTP
jgi:hypothetical protein